MTGPVSGRTGAPEPNPQASSSSNGADFTELLAAQYLPPSTTRRATEARIGEPVDFDIRPTEDGAPLQPGELTFNLLKKDDRKLLQALTTDFAGGVVSARVTQARNNLVEKLDTELGSPFRTSVEQFSNSPRGAAILGALASTMIGEGQPVVLATARVRDGNGSANGMVPLNPDRGVNSVQSPGAHRMEQPMMGSGVEDAKTGDVTYAGLGSPASIPAQLWAGQAGGALGAPLKVDLSLNPAVTRPIEAVGKVLGPVASAVNQAATLAAKTTGAIGAVTLANGAATGTLQAGVFVAGDPARTVIEVALDRIINQPKGSVVASVSAQIPFTPNDWGMRTTLYAGGLHTEDAPYVFPAVVAPGQRGVPPWINVDAGRVKVTSQYNEGWNIGVGGMVVGNENLFVNQLLLANAPRINAPIARTELLPGAKRLTPADLQIGVMASPVSGMFVTEYGLGPVRVAKGTLASPVVARVLAGTQGLSGSTFKPLGMDVAKFASAAPNPSFNPNDPFLRAIQGSTGAEPSKLR